MRYINILVEDLGASQLSYYLSTEINKIHTIRTDITCIVYYHNIHRHCINPLFATMSNVEISGAKDIAIATSINTANKLLEVIGPTKKFYYIWNLEWQGLQQSYYTALLELLHKPELSIITRSESHAALLYNNFNRKPDLIFDNFQLEKLI